MRVLSETKRLRPCFALQHNGRPARRGGGCWGDFGELLLDQQPEYPVINQRVLVVSGDEGPEQ